MIDDEDRRVLSKGSFFGEVSVLLDEPASASIIDADAGHAAWSCPARTSRTSSSPTRW